MPSDIAFENPPEKIVATRGSPMSATGPYGTACAGAPDAAALEHGRQLGRRVAELAKRLRR